MGRLLVQNFRRWFIDFLKLLIRPGTYLRMRVLQVYAYSMM